MTKKEKAIIKEWEPEDMTREYTEEVQEVQEVQPEHFCKKVKKNNATPKKDIIYPKRRYL
jgi:hypothetical protein